MHYLDAHRRKNLLSFIAGDKLRPLAVEKVYSLGALGEGGVVLFNEVPANLGGISLLGICLGGGALSSGSGVRRSRGR